MMKRNIKTLANILPALKSLTIMLALASTVLVPLLNTGTASAAYPPQCYRPLFPGAKPYICDGNEPLVVGGKPQPGQCYELTTSGKFKTVSCLIPPYRRDPLCYRPLFPGAKPVKCIGNEDTIAAGNVQPNHCYELTKTGRFKTMDCGVLPFYDAKASTQIITCPDGTKHNAPAAAKTEVVCKGHNTVKDPVDPKAKAKAKAKERSDFDYYPDPAAWCAAHSDSCEAPIFSNFINPAIMFLSAGVGVIIVTMIIIGGIKYSMAENDPQKLSAARSQIFNALIALVAYILMYGFLVWVVPGAQAP